MLVLLTVLRRNGADSFARLRGLFAAWSFGGNDGRGASRGAGWAKMAWRWRARRRGAEVKGRGGAVVPVATGSHRSPGNPLAW